MEHPWEQIDLETYEAHMSLDSVSQLQALHTLMEGQLRDHPAASAMILGVAGGNGLDYVDPARIPRVYGVDINRSFLAACQARYPALKGCFIPIQADLSAQAPDLPYAELALANLLVEYIGYPAFLRVLAAVRPRRVSVVIQRNQSDSFVSNSPYLHAFDGLSAVHHQIEADAVTRCLAGAGFRPELSLEAGLPNGKKLLRLDYLTNEVNL